MKRSDPTLVLAAGKPAYRGFCVARSDGKVIFIRDVLPGETAEVRIVEEKKDYCVAVAETLLSTSPDRIVPRCRFFGSCGGCHYQYASYARQLELKETILADSFSRIARVEAALSPSLASPLHWGYRRRAQFKVSPEGIGFFREGSRDLVPVDHCPLMTDGINSVLADMQQLFSEMRPLFDAVSEIHLTEGDSTIALIRTKHYSADRMPAEQLCIELLSLGLKGVTLLSGPGTPARQFGADGASLALGGLSYGVSADTFFQANWGLNEELVAHISDSLGPLDGLTVLDLYAGAGNFSLPLASSAAGIIAVEEDRRAVGKCRENARLNNIGNCRCINTSAESLSLDTTVDIVILDPPRPGLTGKVLRFILDHAPERVVYVSCNPATMARDIRSLLRLYEIESLKAVDFFPQTYHIEAVAFLRKRPAC